MTTPYISKELLDYLREVFPDRLPQQPPHEGQMGILIGHQKVIQHLQAQFIKQNAFTP